jgi:hypothetical protein
MTPTAGNVVDTTILLLSLTLHLPHIVLQDKLTGTARGSSPSARHPRAKRPSEHTPHPRLTVPPPCGSARSPPSRAWSPRCLPWRTAVCRAANTELTSVAIKDTDTYREVCSGMFGGKKAYVERERGRGAC